MNATPLEPVFPTPSAFYVPRERYLGRIEAFLNRPVVKILVGMRRVGKSVLLRLLIQRLLSRGVSPENILYINKESLEFDALRTYEDLYRYVKSYFRHATGPRYVILDEVQLIEGWEKAVVSLLSEGYADITLSGSNAQLLSSELATLLSGRYVEIPVYPLTFSEFLSFRKNSEDPEKEFQRYLRYGGLPGIHQLLLEDEAVFGYLGSIIHTVFYKDIVSRYRIRDLSVLDRVIAFIFDNIGNVTSAKGISDYFKNQRIKIPVDTVVNYLHFLESSFLIDRVKRFDLQGKRQLEYHDKFYLNDIGLRHGVLGYRERDIDGILENLVYKELQARGYRVFVGQVGRQEVDFVAESSKGRVYVQVCYSLSSPATVEREFGNLGRIHDHYEKIVLSLDRFYPEDHEGIRHQYLLDFLLKPEDSILAEPDAFYRGVYLQRGLQTRKLARRKGRNIVSA